MISQNIKFKYLYNWWPQHKSIVLHIVLQYSVEPSVSMWRNKEVSIKRKRLNSRNSSSFLHNSKQCEDKYGYYVKCSDYKTLIVSQRCLCLMLLHPVLRSHVLRGKKRCLWRTRIWWMSHESESVRDGPYGLKLLKAIWAVSLPFSLWMINQN